MLLLIGTILILIYPVTASTAYLIRLKNGGEIRTPEYWEDANRIMFYTSGGVVGIQKSLIKDIKASDAASGETVVEQQATRASAKGMTTEQNNNASATVPPQGLGQTGGTDKVNFEYYRDKKRELQGKINQAATRYKEAPTHGDLQAKEQARLDVLEFTKQTYELADELKQKNGGVLPDWWGQL